MEREIFTLLMQIYTSALLLAREHNKVVAIRLLCIDYKSNIWNSKEDELNRHVCRSEHKYLFWKLYILHRNHSISRNIELQLAWDSSNTTSSFTFARTGTGYNLVFFFNTMLEVGLTLFM